MAVVSYKLQVKKFTSTESTTIKKISSWCNKYLKSEIKSLKGFI